MVEGPDVQTVALSALALTSVGLTIFAGAAPDLRLRRVHFLQSVILSAMALAGTGLFYAAGVLRSTVGAEPAWPAGWGILCLGGAVVCVSFAWPRTASRRAFSVTYVGVGIVLLAVTIVAWIRLADPNLLSPWFAVEILVIWLLAASEMAASL